MSEEREKLCRILAGQEHCAHCHEYFDPKDLYPLSNRTPPFPEEFESVLLRYFSERPYYLFCSDCIKHYKGSPLTNMIKMGMRRK